MCWCFECTNYTAGPYADGQQMYVCSLTNCVMNAYGTCSRFIKERNTLNKEKYLESPDVNEQALHEDKTMD